MPLNNPPARWHNKYSPTGIVAILLAFTGIAYLFYNFTAAPRPELQVDRTITYNHHACDSQSLTRQIAIIGAGSGGASTAYHLNKFRDQCHRANITVYERSGYVGGRSTTVDVFDDPAQPVELGASIFVSVNKILVNAVEELGLLVDTVGDERPKEAAESLGVWNGERFVFTQSSGGYYWWNIGKVLWQYGLAPIRAQNLMKKVVGTFLKMYDEPYFPFRSLSQVAFDLSLTSVTSMPGDVYLAEHGIKRPFSTDIIQASTRVNYAQNLREIHGLETMVCLATDGAMAVRGGNWQIFDGMLRTSGAHLIRNSGVSGIARLDDGTYLVRSLFGEEHKSDSYDTVVIAAPLQFADIKLEPTPQYLPDEISYVELHVTLFSSPHKLSPRAFNLRPDSTVPEVILTTLPDGAELGGNNSTPSGFFSISTLRTVLNPSTTPSRKEYLYKVFSAQSLNSKFLSRLLGFSDPHSAIAAIPKEHIGWSYTKVWKSYPYLPPRVTFDDPQLDTNLWYTSGIESFISTMETSSLMGMNVAKLIMSDWIGVSEGAAQGEL